MFIQDGQIGRFMRKVRIALTPRGMRIKTCFPDGLVITGRNIEGYGGRGIYISRDTIEPEFSFLDRFVDEGNVFIDIGANIGIYTLKAAQVVGKSGTVLSLEPFPEMLADLAYNVKLNGFSNVRLRGLCAAGKTGPDAFWTNFGKPNSFSLVKRDQSASYFSVLKMRADELFAMERLDRCDYIKIDAEGAEEEIIGGASHIIETYRPIIQAEVTIASFKVRLNGYSVFQATYPDGKPSPNKLFIPSESNKISVAKQLGLKLCES